ncbi:MAG: isocitrate lyase/PEP mutase family protein [Pseudomonadota bacterium]
MADGSLKSNLEKGAFFYAPGVPDCTTAIIASKYAFDALYISGFWTTASRSGQADVGVATLTEFLDGIRAIADVAGAPLIADADTGFGGLLNVRRTVQGYEDAGVTAIQIEDQVFPKKCGHTPYKEVVPLEDMLDRVKVAADSRQSDDFLIIARTDSRQGHGLSNAIDRANAFKEAGADIVFVEGPQSDVEMKEICAQVDAPNMVNMAFGGHTPIKSARELTDLGFACAIYPALPVIQMMAAADQAFAAMKSSGDPADIGLPQYDFKQFCSDIGFDEVYEFEKKFGRYA